MKDLSEGGRLAAAFGSVVLLSLVLACTADSKRSSDVTLAPSSSIPPASHPLPSSTSPSFSIPTSSPGPSVGPIQLNRIWWTAVTAPFGGALAQTVDGFFVDAAHSVVAWGSDQAVQGASSDPAFWTSADGLTWRVTRLESSESLIVVDVDDGPRGVVAVGFAGSLTAAWSSPDGDTWMSATIEPIGRDEDTAFRAVAAGADGFLAVGLDRGHAAAWFSPDGDRWEKVGPDFPAGRFEDVAPAPQGGFVVVGVDQSLDDWNGSAWLVSDDGLEWHPAPIAGPDDDYVYRVWPFAKGYLAFGQELTSADRNCRDCFFDVDTWRLFDSTDGTHWTSHDIEMRLGVPTLIEYSAIEPWLDGLVAVGRGTDHHVRVWQSDNGVQWEPAGEPVPLSLLADSDPSVEDLLIFDNYLIFGGYLITDDGYVVIGTSN